MADSLGFEYFYGFLGGDTSQWAPALYENIKPIEPPHDQPDYFFDKDMADHAIARIQMLPAVIYIQGITVRALKERRRVC